MYSIKHRDMAFSESYSEKDLLKYLISLIEEKIMQLFGNPFAKTWSYSRFNFKSGIQHYII